MDKNATQEKAVLDEFAKSLAESGYLKNTVCKYKCDVQKLLNYAGERELTQALADDFKSYALSHFAVQSTKSMIAAINKYFEFIGSDVRIQKTDIPRQTKAKSANLLTSSEYARLLNAAKKVDNYKLYLIIETICSSGLHVSEIKYITVKSAEDGKATVTNGKNSRTVFLPAALCRHLKDYCEDNRITSGVIFVTRSGKPVDRSNLYRDIRSLCEVAEVDEEKLFPRNLRNLYTRTRESMEREIVERMGLV